MRSAGFKLIWFDGNRVAARCAFRKRGTVSEEALDTQIQRIEKTGIVALLRPAIVNPFDDAGEFKSTEQLLEDIRDS